jgi:protein SCO1/2
MSAANFVRRVARRIGRAAAAVVLVLAGVVPSAPAFAAPVAPAAGDGWNRLDADEPAPGFALVDQHARRVALADLRGKVVIVTFLFTQCTDVCPVLPLILARVDQHLTEAERARLVYVGISIDAQRDTPEQLRRFIAERDLDAARWVLLTGTLRELTRAADDYGVVVRPDPRLGFVHNTVFALIDGAGRLRTEFHGLASPAPEIAKAVRALIPTTRPRR